MKREKNFYSNGCNVCESLKNVLQALRFIGIFTTMQSCDTKLGESQWRRSTRTPFIYVTQSKRLKILDFSFAGSLLKIIKLRRTSSHLKDHLGVHIYSSDYLSTIITNPFLSEIYYSDFSGKEEQFLANPPLSGFFPQAFCDCNCADLLSHGQWEYGV